MVRIPVEQLQISTRTSNMLHRMGIHFFDEMIEIPIENFAEHSNIGAKSLEELKNVIANADSIIKDAAEKLSDKSCIENDTTIMFTVEQLDEMSQHSIDELGLSNRSYTRLQGKGYLTIDKVAQLSEVDFSQIKGLGQKSVIEIKEYINRWIQENISCKSDSLPGNIDPSIKILLQRIVVDLNPIVHLYWKQLFDYINEAGVLDQIQSNNYEGVLKTVLLLPAIQNTIKNFLTSISNQGVIPENTMSSELSTLTFQPILLVDTALETGILTRCEDAFLISRDTFLEGFDKVCDPNDRASQILRFRIEGKTLQDIGEEFDLTRERVRQITIKLIRKFPLFFEDYFSTLYQYFSLSKCEFCRIFPEITEEGYEYLSLRYRRGKTTLTNDSLAKYRGLWKSQLTEYLHEKEESDAKKAVSKNEMIMRVLISNSDNSLSSDEFVDEYYRYIQKKRYPVDRLKINIRTVVNYLRNTKGIVFDCDNKVRYCDADPHIIWEKIDFTLYKNMVVSSELIFRDYQDVMEELDIRDGYELFYVIKSSLSMWNAKLFPIHCRRVPVMVLGDVSEKTQAIKLLKEISPVAFLDYYEAYEERFGIRSAQGNPVISNALSKYYVNGQYSIDVPAIDKKDVPSVLTALKEKPMWFIEDIEDLFDRVCMYTTHDAINTAAFRRIGYILHTSYAYDASYGTTLKFFDEMVFSKDIIDLSTLDRRMLNLGMFITALDKKKKSLEYVETAPKILMSQVKIKEVYGLSVDEMREIQSTMSVFYQRLFFNGRSIWREVEDLPLIQKLQGNDWMLTCIMRQQEGISSLPVSGGIILSLESSSLSLSRICEWFASLYGTMSINNLEKEINKTFGTRIPASKLAEKLKASGLWDKVVTDSMDTYIDSLVDVGLSDLDVNSLFQEEFF